MEASAAMPAQRPTYEKLRRELRRRLADNLRSERKRLGLTQERTAERAGYSLQYVQRIEREMVNVPLDTIARLALALQVEPAQLVRKPGSTIV